MVDVRCDDVIVLCVGSCRSKVAPAVRSLLLGLACHGIYQHVAPESYATVNNNDRNHQNELGADDPDAAPWHDQHGFRVRQTHKFFSSRTTIPMLITYLLSTSVQSQ
eukprot:4662746-Pyramimonas_sp.AAC.1